ncbi:MULTISPECIES: hypothetical protein [unclassified Rhizobium]|nr:MULTISPECIES: hypothetical protein [unclassified Rhizobium]
MRREVESERIPRDRQTGAVKTATGVTRSNYTRDNEFISSIDGF